MIERAKRNSEQAYPTLLQKIEALGYNEKTLENVLQYIRFEAPIIVHIHLTKVLRFLVEDTHYRNQFETKTSSGTLSEATRTQWEDRLFNNIYHSAKAFDRVKYGVLNILNNPNGVSLCSAYGDCYLLLKKDVRLRTTMAEQDSSNNCQLGVCAHYCHVLNKFSDNELRAIVESSFGYITNDYPLSTYKEVQIHGELLLSRDVESLVVKNHYKTDNNLQPLIQRFIKKNNCNLIYMDV